MLTATALLSGETTSKNEQKKVISKIGCIHVANFIDACLVIREFMNSMGHRWWTSEWHGRSSVNCLFLRSFKHTGFTDFSIMSTKRSSFNLLISIYIFCESSN